MTRPGDRVSLGGLSTLPAGTRLEYLDGGRFEVLSVPAHRLTCPVCGGDRFERLRQPAGEVRCISCGVEATPERLRRASRGVLGPAGLESPIERDGGYIASWRVRDGDAITLHKDREAAHLRCRTHGGFPERLPQPVEVAAAAPVQVPDACLTRCDRPGCDGGRYAVADDSATIRLLCARCGHEAAA